MSREDERHLSTADLAGLGRQEPAAGRDAPAVARHPDAGGEPLAPLFPGPVADDFRQRWDSLQIGFVDDPRQAVQGADELVAQVMKTLAENFAEQRRRIEAEAGEGDTEQLRVALQRYRSFFQRLLSI